MRAINGHPLWIGHAGDLRDARGVMAAGIEAVVELSDSEQMAVLPRELVRLKYPISDGGDNPDWLLRLAVESVASLLKAGVPVLVCCSAGMSRSVCVAACGMVQAKGISLNEALAIVTLNGPADVSPRLLSQFQEAFKGIERERVDKSLPVPVS